MTKTWRILSIDGGGIRGLIPATILAHIEDLTGKRIHELFDLIAGTSTGAILSLGLTKPDESGKVEHSARSLRDLYERDAPAIFRNPASWWENLLRPKYHSGGIQKIMQHNFGDYRLRQAAADIIIPCYDIEQRTPHIFRSRWARRQAQYDFYMRDVASAAAATPTMFDPVRIPRTGAGGYVSLVDGGVFANNPALHAFVEVKTMHPAEDDEYLVVSLGTGESMERLKRKYLTDWGYVRWSVPMLELVSESISESVHRQMEDLLPPTDHQRYYRFQVDLPDEKYALDNAGRKNVLGLIGAAEELLEDVPTLDKLSHLCERLLRLSEEQPKLRSYKTEFGTYASVENNNSITSSRSSNGNNHLLPNRYSITICCVSEDVDHVAKPLAESLNRRHFEPKLQILGQVRKRIPHRIMAQVVDTTMINLVILSPALLKNSWACDQLAWIYLRTLTGENVIMPIIEGFERSDIPELVHHMQWHEIPAEYLSYLFDLSEGSIASGLEKLVDQIERDVMLWLR